MTINNNKELTISSLTGGSVQGAGNFDEIMRAVKSHLSDEYKSSRITGDMYTQAYISALDLALSTANSYTLQHQLTNQQVKLIDAQIASEKLNGDLIQAQINKLVKDTEYVTKQILKVDDEIALVQAQVEVQTKQLEIMDKAILNATKDLDVKTSGILMQTSQTSLINQQVSNAVAQRDQILKQNLKLQSEIDVLDQRKLSELAQTSDTINGQPIRGLLGKQVELYGNQAQGYLRDAEQKAAKILNDTFLTRITTEYDSADATTAGQSDAEVQKVMAKLKAGIGVV